MSFHMPCLAVVAFFLHTAVLGSVMISAFWSLINEIFDPHTGKRAVASIAAGATLGGVLGGVAAWRASALNAVPTMLPLLAAVSIVSSWGTLQLQRMPRATPAAKADDVVPEVSPTT